MALGTVPLKGILSTGFKPAAAARDVTFRIARTGRKQKGRRQLIILRGFVRAEGDSMQTFTVRAMLDSGAEGNFIAQSLARRMGAHISTGDFGTAIEAFGAETKLEQMIQRLHVSFRGAQLHSGLAQEFHGQAEEVLVAPGELSDGYQLLLGAPFLDEYEATLKFGAQGSIHLTAATGATTAFARNSSLHEGEEESIHCGEDEDEWDQRAILAARIKEHARTVAAARCKPETGAQRRDRQRERAAGEAGWDERHAQAAKERPDLVMTAHEMDKLMCSAPPGTVIVTPILTGGWKEGRAGLAEQRVRINQVGRNSGGAPGKSATTAVPGEDGHGALPVEERAKARAMEARLGKDYTDVFTGELPPLKDLPRAEDGGVNIALKPCAQPVGRYGPRMTQEDTEEAGRIIEELLAKGFIRPSRSPWGAPMFLVAKPDGTKRMVIDYRALNAATVRNRYPLPRVDELFDQLRGARYFSKIDLRTGYWQIRMAAEAVEKTAFTSRHGHYEWLVLPMGLTNAPAEFMRMMEETFAEALNKFILVFLDDILIYSTTLEEHERHLRAALDNLRAKKLHAKLSKCSFFRAEVEFLGHYVGRAGVRMVEGKVDAVRAWPTPKKQKDVEQFIGLAGYYRRFIANFANIASPLTQLCGTLKKERGGSAARAPPQKSFIWGDEQQRAFEQLKEAVCSAPCLAMPDPARDFIVHTDASGHATGAVLMQQFDEGLRPIAFLSKKMKPAERNYPIYEQELLAILNALRAWRHYLGGRHFTVWTDHQSLQYVEASTMATPRQVRWAAWLSEFDFSIKYAPGEKNVVADGLSRAAAGPAEDRAATADQAETRTTRLVNALVEMAPMPVRIRRAAMQDAAYQRLAAQSEEALAARQMHKEDGLLYRTDEETGADRLVVPDNGALRTWMLSWGHDALEGGHRGGARLAKWLQARVWWSGMGEDAQRYASSCEACQRGKADQRGKQGMPLSIDTPQRAADVICMDFVGPLPRATGGESQVLVVIDEAHALRRLHSARGARDRAGGVWRAGCALAGAVRRAARNRQRPRLALHIALLGGPVGGAARRTQTQHRFPPTNGRRDRERQQAHDRGAARVRERAERRLSAAAAAAAARDECVCLRVDREDA